VRNLIFQDLRWEQREKLAGYDFLAGDRPFLRHLYTGKMSIGGIDPAQNEFLASLEAKTRKPSPFYRVMAHRPEALKSFVPFYMAVAGPGSVDRRSKELAYLAASITNRCAFCTHAHTAGARKAGITEDEIRALEGEEDSGFSAAEQAVLRYAREVTRDARPSEASRNALDAFFSEEQIVELTMVIAMANFTNRFNNSLGVMPEGQ
jgi:uncharacterized peroxidase-related enzyme